MSNAELWDLDTSGGIMEQIQMLVAPPVSSDALRRSRRRRDRDNYRRPGRTVNHDCCDSCKEGGDLLCCDRCPAAFHLLCHDPPLVEEELPPGEWLCHKCKITPLEAKDDDTESTSSKSSSRSVKSKRSAASVDAEVDSEHPLKTLAKAARVMNPVQFDVGKEISCGKPLPGSSKRTYGRAFRYLPKKQAHELDNGLVPLPAKTCFSCSKSCRVAPLIQCDYCPLLFHLDCLNPPLTSLPTGRWMCPNHVEHFLDSHLLKSQSLTERLRLWDKYTGLVDSNTVKIDFLNRVHRKNPTFRYKRKLPSRPTTNVPSSIKQLYENPPFLLPDPLKPLHRSVEFPGRGNADGPSLEEQEEWLTSVVAMQASITKYLMQKQFKKSGGTKPSEIICTKPTASVAPVVQRDLESFSSNPSLPSSTAISSLTINSQTPAIATKTAALSSTPSHVPAITPSVVASDSPVCDTKQTSTLLLNGDERQELPSPCLEIGSSLPNGPFEVTTRGAVSLLSNSLTVRHPGMSISSTINGDVNCVEGQHSTDNSDCSQNVLRTRSNSVDSVPSPSLTSTNPAWPDADQTNLGTSNKNILVSTLSKNNNASTLVSKVVPGMSSQTAKVILPAGKTSIINNGNSSSRLIVQPSVKSTTSVTVAPSPKVYTVSAGKPPNNLSVMSHSKGVNNLNTMAPLPSLANLNTMLQQWMEGNSDFELTKVDEKLTQILAWQRLQQLLQSSPTGSAGLSSHTNATQVQPPHSCKKGLVNGYLSQQGSTEVRARAMLCPLSGKGEAIAMSYRTLTLGTGAGMDVNLNDYGHCSFISGHHATIFYDEMTRHFELLNYSEHGTTVDNVLYSCDFSDKPSTTPATSSVVKAVREIIGKGSGDVQRKTKRKSSVEVKHEDEDEKEAKARMCGRTVRVSKQCNCKAGGPDLSVGGGVGWEGTSLLHHGSYIKLGCLQYVFSIVDYAPDQLTSSTTVNPDSSTSIAVATAKISSMPLISSSPFLHQQQPMSLLKSHLKSSGPT